MLPQGGLPGGQQAPEQGFAAGSPFIVQQPPQVVVTGPGGQPLAGSGGSGLAGLAGLPGGGGSPGVLDPSLQSAFLQYFGSDGSAGSGGLPAGGSVPFYPVLSLQDQQALASGQLPASLAMPGALPLMQPGTSYAGEPAQQQAQQQTQQQHAAPKKRKQPRPYKNSDQVQAEKAKTAEIKEYCRQLEQQLGRARAELQKLQQENKALQRKAVVLSKHTSFRRCASEMVDTLTQTLTMGQQDWSARGNSQAALDAAQQGLPAPEVLQQLRGMTLEEAVKFYNSEVARVRELLAAIDKGADREAAQRQLEDMFSLDVGKASTFGYLQVVNPQVFAELTHAKLDPSSPVDRDNPAHWRSVLAAMQLSEEQEAQLILLLQSHLRQAEQVVQQKSRVMVQLAEELSTNLLSLELSSSSVGSGELSAALSPASSTLSDGDPASGGGGVQRQSSCPEPLPTKDELDRLIQVEYWLKFDFAGCVRKLLPAQQQALCMVSSYPFYPDQKQLEAAIKEKAGLLWEQLMRSGA